MLDIKEVITILCKYLSDTVDSTLTPEHFRLAKYDKSSDDVINAFWTTLDKLTYFALKEINDNISFANFDKCIRTKLRLAYLQYPSMDVYCSSETASNSSSRALLIALTWLITKHNILKNIIRIKLLNSSLGKEFSEVNINNNHDSNDARLSTVQNQISNLLCKTNKLSNDLKAISELYMQKVKLMTRVHAASITASGLPHLTVSEMSLIKKLATNKDSNSKVELERVKEMGKTASMLDAHMKWTKKGHVFHTWMNTVLDEYEKAEQVTLSDENLIEFAKFIYLLRHIIKKRLKSLKNNDNYYSISNTLQDCPSRLLRNQKGITEAHLCLTETRNQFDPIDDKLQKKRSDLEIELKSILTYIPNCIHI